VRIALPIGIAVSAGVVALSLAATVLPNAFAPRTDGPKVVSLTVDGQTRDVQTTAGTVRAAIQDAGYTLTSHDIVAPAPNHTLTGNAHIVLERGRLLHLTVDGVRRDVWVTAPTVEQALADLGYSDAELDSVSRSTRLPLTPTALSVFLGNEVTVSHDGMTRIVTTTAGTVGAVLAELDLALGRDDTVSPSADTPITAGMLIVIQRVSYATVAKSVVVPFSTQQQPDPTLAKGSTVVVTPGVNGVESVAYTVTYLDGLEATEVAGPATVITPAQAQVVRVGTKTTSAKAVTLNKAGAPVVKATTPAAPKTTAPKTTSPPPPTSAPPATSGLNWDAVAQCESGGNWSINTGNGYYGGLQFSASTWISNGGGVYAATANLATKAQQIAIANKLYAARGAAPWPTCGKYL
jgi:resuscitation-promoting factor RpfB